jgi:uncharacterized protein (TIGR00251 family)
VSGFRVTAAKGCVRFAVHVQPRASRTEIAGQHGAALKVRLHSPPVDGLANEQLVNFLSEKLGVKRQSVRIVSGQFSRAKIVEVDGISVESVLALREGAEKK